MKFAFDSQQVEFRSQLKTLLDKECTPGDVRSEFDQARLGSHPSRQRWGQLASMGVVGLTVPDSEGGLGLGMVDLVSLLEEAGRACLPEPIAETTALAVPFLTDLVREGQGNLVREGEGALAREAQGATVREAQGAAVETARELMRRIAEGTDIATVAPDAMSPVVWGGEADAVILFEPGRVLLLTGGDVNAAAAAAAGPAASKGTAAAAPVSSIDASRRLAAINVPAGRGSVLVEGQATERHLARLRSRGAFASSALLLGAADTLMRVTREYALACHQFGRPIGSFQAVKHHLASAYVKLEMSRPLVYKAASSLDQAPDSAARDCSMAKATASEAALEVARVALQIHGAMGYTWESDIHMWMKRIWVLASTWGDSSSHFAAILDSLAGLRATTVPAGDHH